MNRFTYTGSLLAVTIAGYGSATHAQEACRQEIERLQSQVQERELDTQTERQIEELLESAKSAGDQECESLVGEVREQLDTGSQESHENPDVHAVESETAAQSAPRDRTEAEITIEEPVDESGRAELTTEVPGAATQAERQQQPSQPLTMTDAEAMELVGKSVQSRDGEEIGEISDVARSLADQRRYALVDIGGLLGLGERTVSIPLERTQVDRDGNVTTQMSRNEIESLEEYDPAQYASIEEDQDDRILR